MTCSIEYFSALSCAAEYRDVVHSREFGDDLLACFVQKIDHVLLRRAA
jgi:hypothetical protein